MHGCYFTSLLTFDYKLMVLYSGALHSKRIYCASKNNSLCTQNIFITRLDKQLISSCTAHSQTLLCAQNFKSSWILRTEVRVWPFTRLENTTENSWYLRAGKKDRKRYAHMIVWFSTHYKIKQLMSNHAVVTIAVLSAFDVDDDAACTCIVVRWTREVQSWPWCTARLCSYSHSIVDGCIARRR